MWHTERQKLCSDVEKWLHPSTPCLYALLHMASHLSNCLVQSTCSHDSDWWIQGEVVACLLCQWLTPPHPAGGCAWWWWFITGGCLGLSYLRRMMSFLSPAGTSMTRGEPIQTNPTTLGFSSELVMCGTWADMGVAAAKSQGKSPEGYSSVKWGLFVVIRA